MSPFHKQKLDQIRDERKEQIKQSALKVFANHGMKGTKTSMIAAEAGISEGLIYRYFTSKDELFTTLVQELLEEAVRELEYVHLIPGTPFEQIKTLTQNMLDENNKHAFMLIQQARKTNNASEKIPDKVKKILSEYSNDVFIDKLVPVFVKGQQMNQFVLGNPHELLTWYFLIINSLLIQEQELPSTDFLMRILAN